MRKLAVVLPAYNEESDVEKLVIRWQEYCDRIKCDYDLDMVIIVVDDGSSDSTSDICRKLEKEYSNFTLVQHEHNKGLGEAVKTGIFYTANQIVDAEYLCIMDCDNTHDPKYVLDMLDSIENHDVVIASRYQKGATIKGVAKYRLLTSEGAKYVYKFLLNVKNVKDYTCGYRLYRTTILKKGIERFGDDLISESGFTCMAELLYKIYCVGGRFAEIPFELRYDFKGGDSKMKVLKTAWNSVTLALRLRRIRR